MNDVTSPGTTVVWDPLLRLFHWSLLLACLVAWRTQEQNYPLHLYSGYTVLALVCFRLLWGFVGPGHARFADFLASPATTINYLRSLMRRRARRFLGHNPAGAAMILAMLVTLLVLCISGVALDAAENRSGPLSGMRLFLYTDLIVEIHVIATNVMLALVPLHLIGVALSSRLHRENLVGAMVTGRKRLDRRE